MLYCNWRLGLGATFSLWEFDNVDGPFPNSLCRSVRGTRWLTVLKFWEQRYRFLSLLSVLVFSQTVEIMTDLLFENCLWNKCTSQNVLLFQFYVSSIRTVRPFTCTEVVPVGPHHPYHQFLWDYSQRALLRCNMIIQSVVFILAMPFPLLSALYSCLPVWTRTATMRAVCPVAWTTCRWLLSPSSPSPRRATRTPWPPWSPKPTRSIAASCSPRTARDSLVRSVSNIFCLEKRELWLLLIE